MNDKEKGNSFIDYQKRFFSSLVEITERKNHDYAGEGGDPFANFTAIEKLGVTGTETGILVRMTDKFMRINNFVKSGVLKVEDEKIEDTLKDLANYAALLANYIHHKKNKDG